MNNRPFGQRLKDLFGAMRPGAAFLILILGALVAFEIFNYSTTDHALQDLLGKLDFGGMRWSTILALAFCGIDLAGIARLFTPEIGADEPKEVWYLFGAWLLAATMNAILTWWGVSLAIVNHQVQSSAVIDPKTITTAVPIFVAVMVWVIRILIIGTLSVAFDRALHPGAARRVSNRRPASVSVAPSLNASAGYSPRPSFQRSTAPAQRSSSPSPSIRDNPTLRSDRTEHIENGGRTIPAEPTYHSLTMNARPNQTTSSNRRF